MTTSKKFHLGDVLSVTTGMLVSPTHMEGIYGILNFLTGESLFTHQLPRARESCEASVLAAFPTLRNVKQSTLKKWIDKYGPEEGCKAWVEGISWCRDLSMEVEIDHLGFFEHKDPVDELVEMVGPDRVMVVECQGESK